MILHQLYSPDHSSLGLLRRLQWLIRHDEEDQYLIKLQGSELARLVDLLDQVRPLPSVFCSVMKRALQTLSTVSNDDVSRQCLHELQAICDHRATLKCSYIVSDDLSRVGDLPITLSGIVDVWEGNYRSRGVTIESRKVSLNDDQTLKKVCIR